MLHVCSCRYKNACWGIEKKIMVKLYFYLEKIKNSIRKGIFINYPLKLFSLKIGIVFNGKPNVSILEMQKYLNEDFINKLHSFNIGGGVLRQK